MQAPFYRMALLAAMIASASAALGDDKPSTIDRDKQVLKLAQAYVGSWRGVGQPKRGSSQGAWTEEATWEWRFERGRAELLCQLSGDKYFRQLQLQAGAGSGEILLIATPVAESSRLDTVRFSGQAADDALVLARDGMDDEPARISIRLVAGGDRLLVLYEKRTGANTFARLAEVGSTRQGSSFAKAALAGPECVVTGGLGTIAVEHNGQKYFVCCTGCRDLFRENPEAALEDYRTRKAAERAEK